MHLRVALSLGIGLAVLIRAHDASAQTSDDDAKKLAREAEELMKSGNYKEACPKLARVMALRPDAWKAGYKLAKCWMKTDAIKDDERREQAKAYLEACVKSCKNDEDKKDAQVLWFALAMVSRPLPAATASPNAPTALETAPTASAGSRPTATPTIATVTPTVPERTKPADTAVRDGSIQPIHWAALVSGVIGIIGFGAAAGFSKARNDTIAKLESECADLSCPVSLGGLNSNGRFFTVATDVSLATGMAGAGTCLAFLIARALLPNAHPENRKASLLVLPVALGSSDGAGLVLQGNF